MVELSDIGKALQGFGAGVRGGGTEFIQAQQAIQDKERSDLKALDNERKQALLIDNRNATRMLKEGKPHLAVQLLERRIQDINALGGNSADTAAQLQRIQSGDIQGAIEQGELLDSAAVERGFLSKPAAPAETFESVTDASGNVVAQRSTTSGKVIADPRAATSGQAIARGRLTLDQKRFAFEQAKQRAKETEVSIAEVQSSKILEDGTIIYAMKDGSRVVTDSAGNRIEGKSATTAIKEAVKFGVDTQGKRAGKRATATETIKSSVKKADKAFDKLAPLKKTILSIDQAIQAIDEGAESGVVQRLLPSVKAASIKLDTLMNELGLDVVSSTTFGALSEGELRLALATALPTGLQPTELRKWLVDKKAVQEKLITGLENSVIHLMEGGTISSLVKAQREKSKEAPATPIPEGGPLATPPPAAAQQPPAIKFLGFE